MSQRKPPSTLLLASCLRVGLVSLTNGLCAERKPFTLSADRLHAILTARDCEWGQDGEEESLWSTLGCLVTLRECFESTHSHDTFIEMSKAKTIASASPQYSKATLRRWGYCRMAFYFPGSTSMPAREVIRAIVWMCGCVDALGVGREIAWRNQGLSMLPPWPSTLDPPTPMNDDDASTPDHRTSLHAAVRGDLEERVNALLERHGRNLMNLRSLKKLEVPFPTTLLQNLSSLFDLRVC